MIPKGNLHAHGGRLATYIMKGEDGERAELIDMRGFASGDLRKAFCNIQAIAESQTQCQKPFFHAYVRLPADEALTREQWLETADRLGLKLGFSDQPRGVTLHFLDDGTTHMHVAWSRIDTETMKAIDPGLYLRKMKEVCRELENEFGLREVSSVLPVDRLTGPAKRDEFEEARRLGLDIKTTREAIRVCFDRSDSGPSFAAALGERGMGLARGDRRDYVVIDPEGGQHALGKRICGVTAEDVRKRFGGAFHQGLPSVDALRESMEARRINQPSPTPGTGPGVADRSGYDALAAEVTALWKASDTGRSFVSGIDERGDRRQFVVVDSAARAHSLARLIDGARTADVRAKLSDIGSLAGVSEAQATMERRAALTDHQRRHGSMDEALTDERLKQQVQREVEVLAAAEAVKPRERFAEFEAQKQNDAQAARQDEQNRRQANERRAADGEVNSAESRYAQALGQHYDIRDPYTSLARAAMAEYGQFVRQREDMRKQAEATTDPTRRADIELRMKIEACDYMAITSQRIAGIVAVIVGREDAPQAKADRERAEFWQREGTKAREERAQMMEARQAGQGLPRSKPSPEQTRGAGLGKNNGSQPPPRNGPAPPQTTAEPHPGEPIVAQPVAQTPARRSDREALEMKAAGMGTTPTARPDGSQQTGVQPAKGGGGRGR